MNRIIALLAVAVACVVPAACGDDEDTVFESPPTVAYDNDDYVVEDRKPTDDGIVTSEELDQLDVPWMDLPLANETSQVLCEMDTMAEVVEYGTRLDAETEMTGDEAQALVAGLMFAVCKDHVAYLVDQQQG